MYFSLFNQWHSKYFEHVICIYFFLFFCIKYKWWLHTTDRDWRINTACNSFSTYVGKAYVHINTHAIRQRDHGSILCGWCGCPFIELVRGRVQLHWELNQPELGKQILYYCFFFAKQILYYCWNWSNVYYYWHRSL